LTSKGQILRSASAVALVTVLSRICGYLRDQRIALLLGTSPVADSFIVAFRIPNLVRRMTGEGSFGASFIPVFTNYLHNKPPEEARAFAQRMFWNVAAVLGVLAALGAVFSRQVIHVVTVFSGHPASWEMAVSLNRVIFPVVFFLGLGAVATAILHSFRVFALPAATGVFFNLTLIAFSFAAVYRPILRWLPDGFRTPAIALAVGILAGGVVYLATQLPALVRRGISLAPRFSVSDPGVRTVGRLMGPAFFGMGVYQINMFVDTMFSTSSRMPSGSVMSLYVADRVMQLVLGSYAIAMSTALLPAMSYQLAAGRWDEMKRTFGFSLRIVSFITIPAAAGLILLRHPIIQVLFQHGQFVAESTHLTARALLYYSLGLPAFAAIKLITPMYYSAQDTWTPARVGAMSLGANVLFNTAFLLFFFRVFSNGGPALASALAAYFQFAMLFLLFRRRYGRVGARKWIVPLGKMAACAGAMIAVLYVALRLHPFAAAAHLFTQAALLAGLIAGAAAVYFALAWLLRCEELSEFLLLLRRADGPLEEG